ncbi:MAG: ATP-binding protein, partial [Pirellula sp.]
MDKNLSSLGKRVFLLNNVNDNAPTIFQTRWAFSFLRGPLSRPEISSLMQSKKNATQTSVAPGAGNSPSNPTPVAPSEPINAVASKNSGPPIVPPGIDVRYFVPSKAFRGSNRLEYRPALFAHASIHFVRAAGDIDTWSDLQIIAPIGDQVTEHLWDDSQRLEPKSFEFSDPERDF